MSIKSLSRSDEGGSGGCEEGSVSGGGSSLDLGQLGEPDVSLGELAGSFSEDLVVWLDDGLDNVDGVSSGGVSTGHLRVHLGHGSAEGGVSVLLVHVDEALSGKILQDDSVVLDRVGLSLEDLAQRNDLSLRSPDLVLSLHLIPELGSSDDGILGKYSNSIACWLWVSLAGRLSSYDPVLVEL